MKTEISLFWASTLIQLVSLILVLIIMSNISKLGYSLEDKEKKGFLQFIIAFIFAIQIILTFIITK